MRLLFLLSRSSFCIRRMRTFLKIWTKSMKRSREWAIKSLSPFLAFRMITWVSNMMNPQKMATLLFLGFLNIFFRSQLLFQAHLYIGLAIFCGFVMFDTQVIIRKARNGDKDFIAHSLDLFIDFVQIFRKVLILLMQKDERDNKNKRR